MNNKISFEDTTVAFSYKSDRELKKSYFLFASVNYRLLVKLGTNMVKLALKIKAPVKGMIKKTIFEQFCGGESIQECEKIIEKLSKYNIGAILDYSVEGEDSEADFEHTASEILKTIDYSSNNPKIPFCVFKPSGIASTALLEKVQQGMELSQDEKTSYENVRERFFRLGSEAYNKNVRLFVDSEESWIQKPIDDIVYEMMEKFNKEKAIIFNTYQMYRTEMLDNLTQAVQRASGKYIVGAKLVRGAYMEKERDRAEEKGYPDPILPTKEATDEQYNKALKFCVEHIDQLHICSGSHNEYSNFLLTEYMEDNNIRKDDERVYFAQLYGMSDNISFNLAKAGYNVTKYVPYGPIPSVMPYLFRRAEENSSVKGQSSRELELVRKEIARRKESTAAN